MPKYQTPRRQPISQILGSPASPPPPKLTFSNSSDEEKDAPVSDAYDSPTEELNTYHVANEGPEGSVEDDVETTTEPTVANAPTAESPALLQEDPFGTKTSRELFEAIDELRICGAGQDLEIPQLVIVGKQSAGKSSLLESLTGIPFPTGEDVCTRFATRIISRRTEPGSSDTIRVTIEKGDINPFNREENVAAANAFESVLESLTAATFANVIEKAKKVMGINEQATSKQKHFSSMVLKVELSGPERSYFGILDIPGYFTNHFSTSLRDMQGVQNLIISYMKRSKNIVICVAEATDDLANQDILTKASEYVKSPRIIGVLTKCDLVKEDSAEKIVRHVQRQGGVPNKRTHWFVVQNTPKGAPPSFDREEEEQKTFSKEMWAGVPEAQRGIAKLKLYLADLLCKRIRENFPVMQKSVSKMLIVEKKRENSFGDPRTSLHQQLNYLMTVVNLYQDLATKSLRSPGELSTDGVKLRGKIQRQNSKFNDDMMSFGGTYNFLASDEQVETECIEDPDSESDASDEWTPDKQSSSLYSKKKSTRQNFPPTPILSPHPNGNKPPKVKRVVHPLYAAIRQQMKTNHGEELPGMLNPAVLRPLYREQTARWQKLAEDHLDKVIDMTTKVSLELFRLAVELVEMQGGKMTNLAKERFEAIFLKFKEERRDAAMQELRLQCHRNGNQPLQTTNPDFLQRVRNARHERFRTALTRYHFGLSLSDDATKSIRSVLSTSQPADSIGAFTVVQESNTTVLFDHLHPHGKSQNVQDEIHDILKAYYEISLQNFIAFVNGNIVEPFLDSPSGPLFGLSTYLRPPYDEDEVRVLGGEDELVSMERQDCKEKIKRLEKAEKIAASALKNSGEMFV